MDPLQMVLVAPPTPDRERFLASLPALEVEVSDSVDAYLGREGEGGGILLLGPGLPPETVLALLRHETARETPSSPLLVEEEVGRWHARPLSLGPPLAMEKVMAIAGDPDGEGPILDLPWVIRVVSKARHDLNNPLTSGLAEVQLLLMDEHPPEMQESLETIQEQFRRLRDMVAALSRLRLPRKDPDF
jgi:hypothetical protein